MLFYHFLQFQSAIPRPFKCWAQGCALSLGLMGATLAQATLLAQDTIKQAIQSGHLEQALKLAQQERQSNPKEVQFQFMEGVILAQQGQTDKAIETFKKITETHPELSEAYNNLGVLFAAKGRLEESRNYLEKALQTHPSYAAAHRNLSDVHSQLAKQSYAKALQVDPKTKVNAPQLTLLGSIGSDKRSTVAANSLPATVAPSPKPGAQTTGTSAPPATLPPANLPASAPAQAPGGAPVVATSPVAAQATGVTPAKPSPTASTIAPAQPKSSPSAPTPAAPSAVAAQAKQPAPTTAPQATAAAPAATKNRTSAKTEEADVRAAVQAWAKAWSQKDMSRYFAAYTSSFAGADRQSRAKWESDRQVRIVSKKSISVVANNLKIEVNGNKATVQFQQIYESDNFKGNSRKTLEMVKHGERWLIARETVN